MREMLSDKTVGSTIEDIDLLISLHLPKTGGTSLLHVLKEKYGKGFRSAYGKYASPGSSVRHAGEAVRCIHGHNIGKNFADVLKSSANQKWITFLREPMASAISFYFFTRKNLNKNPQECLFDDRGLEHWLVNEKPARWPNPPGYPFNRFTKAIKSNGLKIEEFSFIGITESFNESMLCLYTTLGWKPIKYKIENRGRYNLPELDPCVVERFKDINSEDYALYEYAQKRLDVCIEQYGPTFAAEAAALEY